MWLDGAHNADAGHQLAQHFAGDARRIHLVTGMLANKHPSALIDPLAGKLASITVVPVPGHEHHGASAFGPEALAADTVEAALAGLAVDPVTEIVLIAGSLYLAGEVLRANGEVPD